MKTKAVLLFTCLVIFASSFTQTLQAQTFSSQSETIQTPKKTTKGAFFRSVLVPGWGHHYLGEQHKRRARFHFTSEVLLWIGYFALDNRALNMQNRMFSYVSANAGVDIQSRDRSFQLAVGQYNTLDEFNDFMERSRNWAAILPNTPENQWFWEDDEARARYLNLRDDQNRAEQQLPGLISLMVMNRVISGLNAFSAARKWRFMPEISVQSAAPYSNRRDSFVIQTKFSF